MIFYYDNIKLIMLNITEAPVSYVYEIKKNTGPMEIHVSHINNCVA